MNYMRETNTWMIRKMRWIFWGAVTSVPIYRAQYWDYLGRRTAWADYFNRQSTVERQEQAVAARADWGFHPRFDAKLDFSIKSKKYEEMSELDTMRDMPRLMTSHDQQKI